MGLGWAVKMERLLLLMKRPTDDARTRGSLGRSPPEIADWHARFLTLLDEGDRVHPRILTPKGKRGRAKQHPGRNLLDRLRPRDAQRGGSRRESAPGPRSFLHGHKQ